MMLTMQSSLLDTVMKMERITGLLRIHGDQHGVIKDSSRLKEESTCAELLYAIHSHLVLKNSTLNFSSSEKIVIS